MRSDLQPMPSPSSGSNSPERLFIRITDAQGRPRRLETKRGGTSRLLALDEMPGEMKSPSAGNSEQDADALTAMKNEIEQAIGTGGSIHLPDDVQAALLEILQRHAPVDFPKVKAGNGGKDQELTREQKIEGVCDILREQGHTEADLEKVRDAYDWYRRRGANGSTDQFPQNAIGAGGLGGYLAGPRTGSLRPQASDAASAARFAKRYPDAMSIGAEGGGGERRRGLAFDARAEKDFEHRFPEAARVGTRDSIR